MGNPPWRGILMAACVVGLCAAGQAPPSAAADSNPGVAPQPGDRLRVDFVQEIPGVRYPIRRSLQRTGTLRSVDSSGLWLDYRDPRRPQDPPREAHIGLSSLSRVRVSAGRSGWRGAANGITWGLLGGVVATALVELSDTATPSEVGIPSSAWLIPAGLGVGLVIGGATGTDVWRDYPLSHWIGDLEAPTP